MLRRHLFRLVKEVLDRVEVLLLRRAIRQEKVAQYDLLAENLVGLRRVIDTQRRAIDDLQLQLQKRGAQVESIREEYSHLRAQQQNDARSVVDREQRTLFRRMQPLLVQLPTLAHATESGADISASDVLNLVAPLKEAFADMGFVPIGSPGEVVPFDPTRHRPVGQGARSLRLADTVRVRYIGYRYGQEVICKAEVTVGPPA